jgi:hypothetical protein
LKLFLNGNLVGYANNLVLSGLNVGFRMTAGATLTNYSASVLNLTSPGLPFSDDFTAAIRQQLSNNWLNQLGNFQVAGGKATAFGSLDIATENGINGPNVFVQADVSVAAGQYAGLVAHYSGPGDANMYWAGINASGGTFQAQIWRNLNGTWTELFAQNIAGGAGTLRFEVAGSSLKLFDNSNLVAYANDSLVTGGTIGMRGTAGTSFDNFSADVLTLTSPILPFSDNFNTATNQQLSNNWLNQLGNFQVAGGVATGLGSIDVATVNGLSPLNSTLQADLNVSVGAYAGLVSRYSGPGETNMYWAGLNGSASGAQAQLWVNSGGVWRMIGSAPASASGTIKLVSLGNSFTVFFNNVSLFSVADSTITSAGLVGIRASAGGTVDNFGVN